MDSDEREFVGLRLFLICGTIILLAMVPPIAWVFSSAMEARTYSRLTGKQVSTWDAMWVELRVQESAK